MKYKVIIFDIDGTIARHISSWRYIHEKLGLWQELAFRYQKLFLNHKISYRKFCELDAAHWKGIKETKIKALFNNAPYVKNAAACIKNLKKLGFKLAAVSTGLQYMADRVKNELGFHYVLSNRLLSRNGVLTGGVRINIAHGAKGRIAEKVIKRFNITKGQIISVGDSAGDIPLAKKSGFSVAFNSSDRLLSKAVDYNCRTKDFKEVYNKILSIQPPRHQVTKKTIE